MQRLETERLVLRGFAETDAGDVYAYAQNKNVGPSAGWPPHQSLEESEQIVRMFMQEGEVWALVDKATDQVIGSIGLHKDKRRSNEKARMIGYVLAEPFWGQGLMPEAVRALMRHAFEDLHMDILSAVYYPFNLQSRRVMEKCGMQYEGTLRMSSQVYSGEVYDDVCFSITSKEWHMQQADV